MYPRAREWLSSPLRLQESRHLRFLFLSKGKVPASEKTIRGLNASLQTQTLPRGSPHRAPLGKISMSLRGDRDSPPPHPHSCPQDPDIPCRLPPPPATPTHSPDHSGPSMGCLCSDQGLQEGREEDLPLHPWPGPSQPSLCYTEVGWALSAWKDGAGEERIGGTPLCLPWTPNLLPRYTQPYSLHPAHAVWSGHLAWVSLVLCCFGPYTGTTVCINRKPKLHVAYSITPVRSKRAGNMPPLLTSALHVEEVPLFWLTDSSW